MNWRAMSEVVKTECPRCGYDLSGAIAAWPQDRCPVEGVCSECGLGFGWQGILRDPALRVPWFNEASSRLRFRGVRTALRTLRAGTFWRNLPMGVPMRVWRLIGFAVVPLVCLYACLSVWAVASEYVSMGRFPIVTVTLSGAPTGRASAPVAWWELAKVAAWPFAAVVQIGSVFEYLGDWGVKIAAMLLLHICMCVVFFTMIVTFARAKVRQRHIVRGVVYGLPIAVVAALLMCGALAVARMWSVWRMTGAGGEVLITVGILSPAVLVLHQWWAFARDYLRLPRSGLIVVTGAVVSVLMTAVIVFAIPVLIG